MVVVDGARRESVAVAQLRVRLAAESATSASDVDAAVDRALRGFAVAPIRDYVPLLVERLARDDLRRHRRPTMSDRR
jgi:hypothetical protein